MAAIYTTVHRVSRPGLLCLRIHIQPITCHVQDESHQETEQENGEHTNTLIGVPDTYQDGEFYQALLSEFLEGSTHLLTKNLHKVCDDTATCTRLTFEKTNLIL